MIEATSLPPYALLLAHLLVVYAVLGEPWLGVRAYRALRAAVARDDPRARPRFYRDIMAVEWAWIPVIAVIVLPLADPVAALGLGVPVGGMALGVGVALLGGAVGGLAATVLMARRDPAGLRRQLEPVADMLPRSAAERRGFAGVSITAGICEELLFRGFLFFYVVELWGLAMPAALVLSSAIFGLAHAYQGAKGILATGAGGLVFGGLYWATGSLWPGIVLHAIIDLRVLLIVRMLDPAVAGGGGTDAGTDSGT